MRSDLLPCRAFWVPRHAFRAVAATLATLLTGLVMGLALSQSAVGAERLDNLYYAERVIAQNADQSRQVEVLADALNEVFRRVSGLTILPDHSALSEARRNPQNLLSRSSLAASEETIPDAIGNPQPTHLVQMTFDRSLVRRTLADAGIPVWSDVRPSTLLLLAGPDGQRIELLPETADVDAVSYVREQARTVGLPLAWPLLDLEDVIELAPADIWGGREEPMEAARQRYQADAVLGGYVGFESDAGRWVGRWHLYFGGDRTSGTYFGEDMNTVVREGMRMAARTMSQRYAVDFSTDEHHEFELTILNMSNLQTHGAVRQYLNDLIGVDHLQLLSLEGDEARYRLRTVSSRSQLLDILALEAQLQEVSSVGFGMVSNPEMEFVWQP